MKHVRIIVATLFMLVLPQVLMPTASAASTKTCSDFPTQESATSYLNAMRALDSGLAHQLDPDGDGKACESLPTADGNPAPKEPARASSETSSSSTKLTNQEETFLTELQSQTNDFVDATTVMSEQFTAMGNDPTLILNQSWIIKTAGAFVKLQQVADDAKTLKPSPRQQHLYITWVEATELVSSATDDYTQGIDNVDANAIRLGTAKITQASTLVNGLVDDLTAFKKNPNIVASKASMITGPVSDCSAFSDYNVAQVYLALNPTEAATLDPNGDGRACEIFFDRDVAA